MQSTILDILAETEQKHGIRILYACESGSRAWGFASADSDWDVRFIYMHPAEWYLDIDEHRDVIELPINEMLDINGWDIRKALRLFRKSNAPLYEWLQSPQVYMQRDSFHAKIMMLSSRYYSPRAAMHHYLSMTRNCLDNDLASVQVKLKKYFYALRPILAAMWIAETKAIPPMEFGKLRLQVDTAEWNYTVDELLKKKVLSTEKDMTDRIPLLHDFVREQLHNCEQKAAGFQAVQPDSSSLNQLFRELLHDF